MVKSPNRLCVLVDRYLMANEARTLENAVERTGIEVPLVLVNEPANPDIDPEMKAHAINEPLSFDTVQILLGVLERDRAWTIVFAEKKLAELFGSEMNTTQRIHVGDVSCISDSEIRYVTPETDGSWEELPQDAVDLVRDRCDLGVRFGFGLLRGEILDAPEFGVLSFHPADIRQYRGLGVPQAWVDGRETMGVTLQRLNESIDGGEIIAYEETDVSECATLWEVYETLYEIKVDLLAKGIENLRDPSFEPTVLDSDSLGTYYSIKRRHTVPFAARTLGKNLRGRLRRSIEI